MKPAVSSIRCEIIHGAPQEVALPAWLEERGRAHGLRWLLAHSDDGVTWGELRDGKLCLSSAAFPDVSPPLRPGTLQQARLFGRPGELLLWRQDKGWAYRLVLEGQGEEKVCYDQPYLLWGTTVVQEKDGFTLLTHGAEGLRHAPPLAPGQIHLPLQLIVRHVLGEDGDKQTGVAWSRLVDLV